MRKIKILKYSLFMIVMSILPTLVFAGDNEYLRCGKYDIPAPIAGISRTVVLMIEIIFPVVLIIMGSIDMIKATIGKDGDAITKAKNKFIKRLEIGIIFFLVTAGVKFVTSLAADSNESGDISKCIDCLISDEGSCGSITTTNPFLSDDLY